MVLIKQHKDKVRIQNLPDESFSVIEALGGDEEEGGEEEGWQPFGAKKAKL